MTDYIFRRAIQNDLSSIIGLLADDKLGRQREQPASEISPSYQTAFDQICSDPNQYLLVMEEHGAIIGTCHLTFMPSLTFQGALRMNIEAVRIDSSGRGSGMGEKMIRYAIELGRQKGCKIIQLTTNKQRIDAIRFYEKLGFKATHEGMKIYL